MSFQSVAREMMALYSEQDYGGALRFVQDARKAFPDQDNALTFWEACLLSRTGQVQQALTTLNAGIERGEWWPTGKLLDADLDPLRAEPEWDQILAHCQAMTEPLRAKRPATLIREGTGSGTIITLKGGHGTEQAMYEDWKDVAPVEWTVVTPFATEPNGDGGWEWPLSLVASARGVADDLEESNLTGSIVLAGFSAGSAIACQMIISGWIRADGLIAIGPWSNSGHNELDEASDSVPTLVICGNSDPLVQCVDLHNRLDGKELVRFDLVPGLEHANPTDLGQRVRSFLAQIN